MNQRKLETQSDLLKLDSLLGYTKSMIMYDFVIIFGVMDGEFNFN